MRFYKNKPFQRDAKNGEITDEDLNTVIDNILDGRSIPLGARLYKIRGATEYDNLTDKEIEHRVYRGDFTEINYEKQK